MKITPSSSSNKIRLRVTIFSSRTKVRYKILRDETELIIPLLRIRSGPLEDHHVIFDVPASAAEQTYKLQMTAGPVPGQLVYKGTSLYVEEF